MQKIEVPAIPLSRIAQWTLGVLAVGGIFWFLIRFREIWLLLIAAMMIGTAVFPLIRRLEKWECPRPIGALLLFSIFLLGIGLFFWYATPLLIAQSINLQQNLSEGYAVLVDSLSNWPNILVRRLVRVFPEELNLLLQTGIATAEAGNVNMNDLLASAGNGLIQITAVLALTFFLLLEGPRLQRALIFLVPLRHRDYVKELQVEVTQKIRQYIVGQLLLCLVVGSLAFIIYSIIGVPNALLLGIFAGIFEAVPILGPGLGALPALIVALSISPEMALWVILAAAAIQQFENTVLVPRVMNQTIGIKPLVTLLALLIFSSLFGIVGALVALPLAAVFQILLSRFLALRDMAVADDIGRSKVGILQYQADQLAKDIRHRVRAKGALPSANNDSLEDEIETLVIDLQSYLAGQTQTVSQETHR